VPLSDHEQKLLAQMEQALYAEDPKFATALTGRRRGSRSTLRVTIGIAAIAIGLLAVIGAIFFAGPGQLVVAIAGFVIMFAGAVFAVTGGGSKRTLNAVGGAGTSRRTRSRPSFVQRMEQRWERRRSDGWQ